jgi:hypothetical protein
MHPKLSVSKQSLVLEIGSGHNPHPRADILLDRSLLENAERQNMALKADRPLVIGTGECLPFKNNSFNFVYAAQVLEHAGNPELFAKELMRVSIKGLIVVPHTIRERLFGWPYHQWYFWRRGTILGYFPKQEKTSWIHSPLTHGLFAKTLWFRRQLERKEKELNIYYYWHKKINLRLITAKDRARLLLQADAAVREIFVGIKPNIVLDWLYWLSRKASRIKGKFSL